MVKTLSCIILTLCLSAIIVCKLRSDRSLTAFCIEKFLKDLVFLAKDLKDQVSILLSVIVNDNTKFVDIFKDFHYGQKNTEIMVTSNSIEAIKDSLHRFFRHDTNALDDMIINYKIKFCYFSK